MPSPGHLILYYETYKMLLRGALFHAPHSVRDSYVQMLEPIILGGRGTDDSAINHSIQQEEINLLREFAEKMQEVPIPELSHIDHAEDLAIATKYVHNILSIADQYIKKFNYFQQDLQTITDNIKARKIILQPDPTYNTAVVNEQESSILGTNHTLVYSSLFSNMKITDITEEMLSEYEQKAKEDSEKELEDFLNDSQENVHQQVEEQEEEHAEEENNLNSDLHLGRKGP